MAQVTPYQHYQTVASNTWVIKHNLNAFPIIDVMVMDSNALRKILPLDILVIDLNTVEVHFTTARVGQARLA